jgi:hypothetical protein
LSDLAVKNDKISITPTYFMVTPFKLLWQCQMPGYSSVMILVTMATILEGKFVLPSYQKCPIHKSEKFEVQVNAIVLICMPIESVNHKGSESANTILRYCLKIKL